MTEYLILVDENDAETGKAEKLFIHQNGLLHRAFSVFIFNSDGELLLQQRADAKYHSGGLWTNTCCSHPQYGEQTADAVNRRLKEEMGLFCETNFAFSFIYKAGFSNGLTEHEFDHVYIGYSNDKPEFNPKEVQNWKYMSLQTLCIEIDNNPETYTEWLKICLPQLIQHTNTF